MITRERALRDLLECIFGNRNVSLSPIVDADEKRRVNLTGKWFGRIRFDRTDWNKYCQLFEVVFGRADFILYDTNGKQTSYTRENAIENVIEYFQKYDMDVSCLNKRQISNFTLLGFQGETNHDRTETWDKPEIIKRAFCDCDGILFCILVSDEGKRALHIKPKDEEVQYALYSVLNAKKAFIKREMSDFFQGEVPNIVDIRGTYNSKEEMACEYICTIEHLFGTHNKTLFYFPFPIQIDYIALKKDMHLDETATCYRAIAWEIFVSRFVRPPENQDEFAVLTDDADNATLRRKVIEGKTNGRLSFEVGRNKLKPFSCYSTAKCSIRVEERMVIEYASCAGKDTLNKKIEKAYEMEYERISLEYQKYCESALDYLDEVFDIIAELDFKMIICRKITDIGVSQVELKKIVSNYNSLFHALSGYEENKTEYHKQMYLIIQYYLLRVTWILQSLGDQIARAFRENTDQKKLNVHKGRIDKFIKVMKEKDIITAEEAFEKQNQELYKMPKRIEDVYTYRSPDMIKNLMDAVENYREEFRKKTK